ncbi:EamA family transporter [Ramlibacter algicola]|uniref:EamA domain-containing protein n=1 Tax=Ramlibacter algicola TaxID=2795217 RepID=A0A934Q4E9_9BURK|nr:EamA family transporter [Ramlibacter algicola]MBK0394017.1 hypothetical protein [Ramlibacter algicola]
MKAPMLALAVLGAVLAALGQVSLKWGAAGRSGVADFLNAGILLGLLLYAAGTLSWIRALAEVPLTALYPFTALTYVLVNLLALALLGEQLSPRSAAGTGLVLLGLFLVAA